MYGIINMIMPAIKIGISRSSSPVVLGSLLGALQPSTAGDMLYGVLKFIYFVFICVLILALAYLTTKYIAKKGVSNGKSRNLKIVETLGLGIDKSIMLVKVGEQYFLMANSGKNLTLLTAIEPEKLVLQEANDAYQGINKNVDEYLSSLDNSSLDNNSLSNNTEVNDYFATVKQNLRKLKSIVRGSKVDE